MRVLSEGLINLRGVLTRQRGVITFKITQNRKYVDKGPRREDWCSATVLVQEGRQTYAVL